MWKKITRQLEHLYQWALEKPYLGVLVLAAYRTLRNNHKDMAAGITFYTLLSLFPLLLGLISIGGFFLKSAEVQLSLNNLLVETLPLSADFVSSTIESLVRIRGAAGLTSVLILMWSASRMVGALSRAINGSLDMHRSHASYLSPLRYFVQTLTLALLIFLTMAAIPLVEVATSFELGFVPARWEFYLGVIASHAVGIFITAIMVATVYMILPFERLQRNEILPGLLVAVTLIEAGKTLFVLYIERSTDYSTIYGSVSSVIVLLIWLYFCARVLLYGTEIINVLRVSGDQSN